MCTISQTRARFKGDSLMNLNVEELTYVYETLNHRNSKDELKDSHKEKKMCKKIMSYIEDEILAVEVPQGEGE